MARAVAGMKLHLGSGTHPTALADWLNLDLPWAGAHGVDIYADAFHLPFADDCIDATYLGHVCEHFSLDDLPLVLAEVRRVMRCGAPLGVVGPAIDLAERTDQPESLLRAIDTLGEGPGAHKWVATEEGTLIEVQRVFPDARLVPVEDVAPPQWPNVSCAPWQVAVLARA